MNPREKKLLFAILAVAALGFGVKVVYPKLLAPMFDYDKKIAALRHNRDSLDPALKRIDAAVRKYQEYSARTIGGTDAEVVRDEFRHTIHDLFSKCHLTDPDVSPKEPVTDRKTDLVTLNYSFRAEGTLQEAITFMRSFYEIPYVARFKDVKLTPNRASKGVAADSVKIAGSIDVLVPPRPDRPVPTRVEQAARTEPKYRGPGDFALIWERDPFNAPAKPQPPVEPTRTVVEVQKEEPPPPVHVGPQRDPQGAQKIIRMCMQAAVDEVLVVHAANKQREFVAKGQDLDGGKILMVHPLGALVRRNDGGQEHEFLYPVGESLADSVRIDQAQRHPELRVFAKHYLAEERAKATKAAEGAAAGEAAVAEQAALDAPLDPRLNAAREMYRGLMGPPAELAGPERSDGLPFMQDAAAEGMPSPRPDEPDAFKEWVGPPVELAGPQPPEENNQAKRKLAPRKPRTRKPAGVR